MPEVILQMKGINKTFGTNRVLTDADLTLHRGEVLGLLGENGAGKSTLMKILTGIYPKDSGDIYVEGREVHINNADDGKKNGIRIIHQELMLGQDISVAENIFMGQEKVGRFGLVNLREENEQAQELLDRYHMDIRSTQILRELTIAQQQMVEVVRAISFGAKIVVMDEPTSSLSHSEIQVLYEMIDRLKKSGVGIIYISHKLNELFDITDYIEVLRDGCYVDTVETAKTNKDQLVQMMVGREIGSYYYKTNTPTDEIIMEVRHLADGGLVRDVSFDLHRGEILGCAGLVGAGRSETMQCIMGLSRRTDGDVLIEGRKVFFTDLEDAIDCGLGYMPEDRKLQGLFLQQGVDYNITINMLSEIIRHLRVNHRKEQEMIDGKINQFSIKASSPSQRVSELSGGNQQKILIARWVLSTKKILILDEPTRGVDVKSKAEIYQLIDWIVNNGVSVVMVSSELAELINMSDRICVFCDGSTTGILGKEDFTQEKIMALATT